MTHFRGGIRATLLLLRHGQSTTNADQVFTGWSDPPLTEVGRAESCRAAGLLAAANLLPDGVHTSLLRRAVDTAELVVAGLDQPSPSIRRTWRLNERHYGALTGRRKAVVREQVGADLFDAWRRSWGMAPPPAPQKEWRELRRDPRYLGIPDPLLPTTESLHDVAMRLRPYWAKIVVPQLTASRTPLVVSHGNTLRSLIAVLDELRPEAVRHVDVPTGVPLRYDLDDRLRPIIPGGVLLEPAAADRVAALVATEGIQTDSADSAAAQAVLEPPARTHDPRR